MNQDDCAHKVVCIVGILVAALVMSGCWPINLPGGPPKMWKPDHECKTPQAHNPALSTPAPSCQ